jgi:hypothetical protein
VKTGTSPDPAQFLLSFKHNEIPIVTATAEIPSPQQLPPAQPRLSSGNPYARGRIPSGTMPHPSMRFEEPGEAPPVPAAPTSPPVNNPYARGRIPGGTMPHPSSRFEMAADTPDEQGGQRGKNPPGGKSSFVFG